VVSVGFPADGCGRAGSRGPEGINNTNPVLDKTGTYAAVVQENRIGPGNRFFFLAGTFGGSATPTVTVPKGMVLFFPTINVQIDNAVDPAPDPALVAHEPCQIAAMLIDTNEVVQSATLDGQPIATFRMRSMPFAYKVAEAHSVYTYFGLVGPQFEGTIAPYCTDGYWAVLGPLAPGQHVLEFHAADKTGFAVDVIYYLTVLQTCGDKRCRPSPCTLLSRHTGSIITPVRLPRSRRLRSQPSRRVKYVAQGGNVVNTRPPASKYNHGEIVG
jgi:hypothetical protein